MSAGTEGGEVRDVGQPAYPASADPAFNLTGGPSGATTATLAALGRPVLHHLDPAFGALYQRTAELLQQAFGTRESPVILPGEAVVGLEAAAASLIGPEDVALNLVSGSYGRGYGAWARRYAREVVEIEVPYDSSVPAASVADATSGFTTYAASRVLELGPPGPDGRVVLDFNRAANPPCAYTDLATCPLPPPENRLPVAIEAGERTPDERRA
jgi:hypothetical protein